jgi:uncharacterized membrane protein YhiD involved in acid resistance
MATLNMTSVSSIPWVAVIANLSMSLLLGFVIALVYRKAFVGILFQKSFAVSLVLIALVTTMVIMVISGNLVLSLGMVGALSIVRFRAAIKEPIDIVYMFWAVGVGIANGVGVFSVSIISTIFISLVLLYAVNFQSRPKSKLLVIKGQASEADSVSETIKNNFRRSSTQKSFSQNQGSFELVYELADKGDITETIQVITKMHTDIEIRVLSYPSN